jgi:hypothetical protein
MWLGRHELGPAAPTAACTPRTWDPVEDALTLAWPWLPGRVVGIGETWDGARVGGRCNKTACIDPETYAGGAANHHRPCVTERWQETLVGLYDTEAGLVAAIESSWSDGHGAAGIHAERRALVAVDHGRPLYSRTTIYHPFPYMTQNKEFSPITRTWTAVALDDCAGGPVAAGRSPGADEADRAQRAREGLQALLEK